MNVSSIIEVGLAVIWTIAMALALLLCILAAIRGR